MAEIFDWAITAGGNNSAPPNGFPENMDYRDVNDAARETMAVIARWRDAVSGVVVSTGTQPAYVLTVSQTFAAYAAGMVFAFKAHASATGAVTLNVNTKGAVNVLDSKGNQLGSGDVLTGGVYIVAYTSGGNFRVIGHLSATSIQALTNNTARQAYVTTGTQPDYAITTGLGLTAYADGQLFPFIAHAGATGAVTLNVDGLGAGSVLDDNGDQLTSGDIRINGLYLAVRRSTAFRIIGEVINLATQVNGTLPITNGGTGAITQGAARTALGLGTGDSPTFANATAAIFNATDRKSVDTNGYLTLSAGTPVLNFDTNDFLSFTRAANTYTFSIGGSAVLTLGANGLPAWQLIEQNSASGVASFSFSIAGYDEVEAWVYMLPATDGVKPQMRFNQGAGVLTGANDYKWGNLSGDSRSESAAAGTNLIEMQGSVGTQGNVATEAFDMRLNFRRPNATGLNKRVQILGSYGLTSGLLFTVNGGGMLIANTNPITAVQCFYSSGNVATAVWSVFGRKLI